MLRGVLGRGAGSEVVGRAVVLMGLLGATAMVEVGVVEMDMGVVLHQETHTMSLTDLETAITETGRLLATLLVTVMAHHLETMTTMMTITIVPVPEIDSIAIGTSAVESVEVMVEMVEMTVTEVVADGEEEIEMIDGSRENVVGWIPESSRRKLAGISKKAHAVLDLSVLLFMKMKRSLQQRGKEMMMLLVATRGQLQRPMARRPNYLTANLRRWPGLKTKDLKMLYTHSILNRLKLPVKRVECNCNVLYIILKSSDYRE